MEKIHFFKLGSFRGADLKTVSKLEAQGTPAADKLLAAGATLAQQAELVARFGVPESAILPCVKLSDLARLGFGGDPRLAPALELVLSKRDGEGRWKMEYTYNGKTWADLEQKGGASKWVALRVLRVHKQAGAIISGNG